jgi:hypothetical protein
MAYYNTITLPYIRQSKQNSLSHKHMPRKTTQIRTGVFVQYGRYYRSLDNNTILESKVLRN